jgi:glycosyltransferase involved in cell wall biosynthesis
VTPTYELDIVIEALARLAAERPDLPVHLDVFGRGDAEPSLRARADGLGLGNEVTFHGRIPIEDVPAAIAAADIGIAPTRRDAFTDVSLSTKIFEYAAMGKPVIASHLPLVAETFPSGTVVTYEPGDPAGVAAAVLALVDHPVARETAIAATGAIVEDRSWEHEATDYVALIERLMRSD